MARVALTREISPDINRCELTHLERTAIDVEVARSQHREYERALEALGCRVERVAAAPELPDSVFVEDTVVVLDEIAILTRPGAPSRLGETAGMARAMEPYRRLARIEPPGTLDGGDVLRVDRTLFVGCSGRSNTAGIAQLGNLVAPFEYEVRPVPATGCLHLKTAVTLAAEHTLVINPAWADRRAFSAYTLIECDPAEPFGANVLRIGETVVHARAWELTRRRLESHGISVVPVDASELARAEAGVTCCSVVFEAQGT